MLSGKNFNVFIVSLCLIPSLTSALHEDQAGTWDWYRPFIGHVSKAVFSTSGGHRKRAYVSTDDGTVAAIHLRTGEPVWRQAGAGPEEAIDHLLLTQGDRSLITLSSRVLIRAWGPADGLLLWEARLHSPGAAEVEGGAALLELERDTDDDDVPDFCSLANGIVQLRSSGDGSKLWALNLTDHLVDSALEGASFFSLTPHPSDDTKLLTQGLMAGDEARNGIITLEINLLTGQVTAERSANGAITLSPRMLTLGAWTVVLSEDGTQLVTSSAVSQSQALRAVSVISILGKKKNLPATALASMESHLGSNVFTIRFGSETAVVKIEEDGELKLVYHQEGTVVSASLALRGASKDASGAHVAGVVFTHPKNQSTMLQVVDVLSGSVFSSEAFPDLDLPQLGGGDRAFLNTFQRKDGGHGFRLLLVGRDASLSLLQQGSVVWTREESLGSIQDTHFVDLPPEKGGMHVGTLSALVSGGTKALEQMVPQFLRHLYLQMLHIKVTLKIASAAEVAELLLERRSHGVKLRESWDAQGFRKIIVVQTRPGKLLGLHNGDGRVLWSRMLPAPASPESSPHSCLLWRLPPQDHVAPQMLTVTGNNIHVIDAWTGALVSSTSLPFSAHRVLPTQLIDSEGRRVLLLVAPDHSAHIFPDTSEASLLVLDHLSALFYYEVEEETDSISGYAFTQEPGSSNKLAGLHLWTVAFPEKLLTHASRSPEDHVHSHTRILGDRSTLYKYLNPNTLFVATSPGASSSPAAPEPHVTAYLLDTVSGKVLYRVRHQGATGPVQAVFSEHWVVYHYWNVHASRNEVSVLEVYDDDATRRAPSLLEAMALSAVGSSSLPSMSSLSLPAVRVLGQSYFFSLGVKTMGVTSTHKGITSKNVLLGTSTDQVLALEKRFLDPRRPTRPSPTDREEGLVPYSPNLPIIPHHIITTTHQVVGLRGIVSAPSRLESTSLVFAFGLDLFYTRVTPSKMYDTLDDHEFSYALLVFTLVALVVGTIVTGILVQQKELQMKWK